MGKLPIQDRRSVEGGEEVEIFLVFSCCRNRDKFQPYGPLDSYAG